MNSMKLGDKILWILQLTAGYNELRPGYSIDKPPQYQCSSFISSWLVGNLVCSRILDTIVIIYDQRRPLQVI